MNLLSKRLAFKESRENEHDGVSQLSENRSSGQNKAASKGGCMRLIYILAWELIQIEEDLALFQTRLRTSTVVVVFGVVAQGHDEDGMHTVVIKIQEFIHLVFIETFDRCGINAEGGGAVKQCCHCDIGLLSFPVESLAGTFTQINKEFSGFEAFFGNFFVGNAAVFDFLVRVCWNLSSKPFLTAITIKSEQVSMRFQLKSAIAGRTRFLELSLVPQRKTQGWLLTEEGES